MSDPFVSALEKIERYFNKEDVMSEQQDREHMEDERPGEPGTVGDGLDAETEGGGDPGPDPQDPGPNDEDAPPEVAGEQAPE